MPDTSSIFRPIVLNEIFRLRSKAIRHFSLYALILLLLAICGCAALSGRDTMIPVSVNVNGTTPVSVLVVTIRQRATNNPGEMFTGERAEQVSYAAVTVSIPPNSNRTIGQVQWPVSMPPDPNRDFVTTAANYIDRQTFVSALATEGKPLRPRKALIFVHGFNNRFDEAVYRFAQIVHDSHSPAIPILFTWPSRGEVKLRSYTYDRESANYSRDALEELLDTLSANPNISEVNIVAHSMGNWVTLEALRGRSIRASKSNLDKRGKPRIVDRVKHAFLVAPDVDVDVFRTQIQRMGSFRPEFLIFLSRDDKALALSQEIWGGVPRVGEIDPTKEPYRSELAKDRIQIYDLTTLQTQASAHSKAFDDITYVVEMIRQKNPEEFRKGDSAR